MKKLDNVLLVLAVVTVIIVVISSVFTLLTFKNLSSRISAFVSNAEANLTIEQSIQINFTTRAISWGAGRVYANSSAAALTTYGLNNVTNGNWTLTTFGGLRLVNDGNVNLTLNLSLGKSAVDFIGGTLPAYMWNVSTVEAGSCVNSTGGSHMVYSTGFNLSTYYNSTIYHPRNGSIVCGNFTYVSGADEIRIDFNLTVPEDATSGAKGDIITATAWLNQ